MPDGVDGMIQTPPSDAISSGADATPSVGRLSFLSAEWVNQRVANVTARVQEYLDRIIDKGLLADGYLPFETPLTDELLSHLTPDQFRAIFDSTPTLAGKAQLLDRMKSLHLPPHVLLPFEQDMMYPPSKPSVTQLAHEPPPAVSSS